MFEIVSATGAVTVLIAAILGVILTRSITRPLERLMERSWALARGEFESRIPVVGEDELAQLGVVFNETGSKLHDLYQNLRTREKDFSGARRILPKRRN